MAVAEKDVLEETADGEEISAEDIDGSFVPRVKQEVTGVEIDGEAVLLIEGPWSVHWLNQISTIVLNEFDGISTVDEAADRLSRAFQADPEVVRNDVRELARQLGRGGFLEGVAVEEFRYTSPSMEGLPVGTAVPPFELPDLAGRTTTQEALRGRQTILVNWSPTCGYCARIGPEIAELQSALRERGVQTVLISSGGAKEVSDQLKEFGLDVPALLQEEDPTEIFSGMGTPVAYLVDAEGKTASELAFGADQVPILIRAAAGIAEETNGSKKAGSARQRSTAKKSSTRKSSGKPSTRAKSASRTKTSSSGPKRRTTARR